MKRKLVDHIVDSGIAERKEIHRCVLQASMDHGSAVDEITERLDVDQKQLAELMADYWGLEFGGPGTFDVDEQTLKLIPGEVAHNFGAFPLSEGEGGVLEIAVYDVEKARPLTEKIRDQTGMPPEVVMAPRDALMEAVAERYGFEEDPQEDPEPQVGAAVLTTRSENKKARRLRPKRRTSGSSEEAVSGVESSDEAGPTRQVEFGTDNPFMDLVDETAEKSSDNQGDEEEEPETRTVEKPPAELFADAEESSGESLSEASSEPVVLDEESSAEANVIEDADDESSEATEVSDAGEEEEPEGVAGALEEFDAELGDEEEDREIVENGEEGDGFLTTPSTVHWGEYGGGAQSPLPEEDGGSGAGSRPDGGALAAESSEATTEESAIFPVGGDSGAFFDFDDEEDEGLTLAEVVERQRRIIQKLEREIDYQKGLLQTLAELLVESRVISKRKLKKSLSEFRKKHQEKNE